MCNFSMNAALFRCLACRPAAFCAVWGGQPKGEPPLADFKFHAAARGIFLVIPKNSGCPVNNEMGPPGKPEVHCSGRSVWA